MKLLGNLELPCGRILSLVEVEGAAKVEKFSIYFIFLEKVYATGIEHILQRADFQLPDIYIFLRMFKCLVQDPQCCRQFSFGHYFLTRYSCCREHCRANKK